MSSSLSGQKHLGKREKGPKTQNKHSNNLPSPPSPLLPPPPLTTTHMPKEKVGSKKRSSFFPGEDAVDAAWLAYFAKLPFATTTSSFAGATATSCLAIDGQLFPSLSLSQSSHPPSSPQPFFLLRGIGKVDEGGRRRRTVCSVGYSVR